MEKFQAEPAQIGFEDDAQQRRMMYALIGAVMLALPQKAEALEFPKGTDWYGGIQRIEETVNNEDNEWGYVYFKTKSSGAWISPHEGSKDTGQFNIDETMGAVQKGNSEKSIERICFGHTHPTSNYIIPGPSYTDISQLPKLVNSINELSVGSSSVFSDRVSVAGMMSDANGIWYFEGYNPELVAKNIASEIEPERIELIKTVKDWLDGIVNASQSNTTFNELRRLMLDEGYEINKSSPEQIANTLWETVKIIPEDNNFEVGKTFGLLLTSNSIPFRIPYTLRSEIRFNFFNIPLRFAHKLRNISS